MRASSQDEAGEPGKRQRLGPDAELADEAEQEPPTPSHESDDGFDFDDLEQHERWYREECLAEWRQWVRWNRPCPNRWCELKGWVPRTGMDPDDEDYVTWARFDINDFEGGHDEDGCPNGVHPWSRPRMRGYHWAVLRELLRRKQVAHYWYESAQ